MQNSASEGKLGKWQVSVNRDKKEIVLKAERQLGCQSDGAEADSRVSFKKMQINTCKLTDDVKQRNKKGETKEKVQGLYSGANHRGKPQYNHLLKSKSSASPLTEKLSHAKKKLILRESTNLALSK